MRVIASDVYASSWVGGVGARGCGWCLCQDGWGDLVHMFAADVYASKTVRLHTGLLVLSAFLRPLVS